MSILSSSSRRVLITGGAGFLGRALVEQFRAAGWSVRSLDLAVSPSADEPHLGSVADPAAVASACAGVDAIVIAHMAPQGSGAYDTPVLPFDINVKGTALLCAEAARLGIKRIVLISSISVVEGHRSSTRLITRDLPPLPVSTYGLTKHLQEQIIEFHVRAGYFTAVSLRPCYVTDSDTLADKYRHKRPSVNWQFIDRRDVADAAVAALAPGCDAQGTYFIHGHPAGARHLEVEPTERDLRWTARNDFSQWPDDAPEPVSAYGV